MSTLTALSFVTVSLYTWFYVFLLAIAVIPGRPVPFSLKTCIIIICGLPLLFRDIHSAQWSVFDIPQGMLKSCNVL